MFETLIKKTWFFPVVFLLIGGFGVVGSLTGYSYTRSGEQTDRKLEFNHLATSYFSTLDTTITNLTSVLRASRALFYASSTVTRDEFNAFVKALDLTGSVRAVEWIPRVRHAQRRLFESAMRGQPGENKTFTERSQEGNKVPAARRAEYFPVYFVEPLAGNEAAVGFDLASNPTRRKALNLARDTGKAVATGRINLVQDAGGEYGFLVFVPVYAARQIPATVAERRENLAGFVLAVFQFDAVVQAAARRPEGIDIHIVDKTAPADKSLLYPKNGKDSLSRALLSELQLVQTLAFGERLWSVVISSDTTRGLFKSNSTQAYVLLIGGLLFTALLLMFFRLIQRRSETVERDVRLRTEELEEANASIEKAASIMEAAYRRAEAANRSKSEYVARISHEIRTPLSGLIGVTDNLLSSGLTPGQKKHAQIIRDSGKGLNRLLNDLLDLSKIEAGQLELEIIDFRIFDLMDSVNALWQGTCKSKSLFLKTDISPELPLILRTDPNRVRQVLMNLVSNAVKFTETGGISISVTGRELSDGDLEIRFDVTDTGIGIDPEAQQRLFSDYQQAHQSTARKFGGTGLGLAICKQLSQRLGGSIGASSTPKAGSNFWFTIHCEKGDPDKVRNVLPAPGDVAIENYQAEHAMHILVTDDNKINRMLLKEMLCRWGHRVDVAVDGREALAAVKRTRFDLVLMDVHMPEMDGVTATRKIRSLPGEAARTLIIGVSADAMNGVREEYLAAGMDDYLTKPIEFAELAGMIDRLCGCNTDPDLVETSVQMLTGQKPAPAPATAETTSAIEDLMDRMANATPAPDPMSKH